MNASATDSGNGQSGGTVLEQFVVSPDGTKVAFQSRASNLGATDTNGATDVYLRDLTTGTTTLVSANAAGTDSGNSSSVGAPGGNLAFSPDGTKLVFDSMASNLTSTPDGNGSRDVFVRDLTAGTTTLVSQNIAGTASANGLSTSGAFDPTGDLVAFTSFSTNGALGDTNATGDIHLRNLASGATTLLSPNAAGTNGGNGNSGGSSQAPAFSPDGTKVIFTSSASNLGPTDANGTTDSYMRDLATNTTSLVSANAAGTASANARSTRGSFSPDGTKIVLSSMASNLGPTDTNTHTDIYVRDLATGTYEQVSANVAGSNAGNALSWAAGIAFSPDGLEVVFSSDASNLVGTDTNGASDVFVRDLVTDTTTLVTANSAGNDSGNGASTGGSFGPDGSTVAFASVASNLVSTDTNGTGDVFVRSLGAGPTTLVSVKDDGSDSGNGRSADAAYAGSLNRIVFASLASNLGSTDSNGLYDLYVATLPTTPPPCETTTTSSTSTSTSSSTTSSTTSTTESTTTTTTEPPPDTTTTTEPSTTTTEGTIPPEPGAQAATTTEPCETTTTTVDTTTSTSEATTTSTTVDTTTSLSTTTTETTTTSTTDTVPPPPDS